MLYNKNDIPHKLSGLFILHEMDSIHRNRRGSEWAIFYMCLFLDIMELNERIYIEHYPCQMVASAKKLVACKKNTTS